MKLAKVKIKNFRCFGPEETVVEFDDFTAIIGTNSSGKTALLNALLKMFGETSTEREITRADFHVPKGTIPGDISKNSFSIEAIFEFPEIIHEDGSEKYTVPLYFENFVVDGGGAPPYLRVLLEATWEKSNSPDGLIDNKFFYVTTSEQEQLSEDNKKSMNSSDRSHIKLVYVPAVRNPTSQLKNASGTLLWRVLRGISWSDADKENIANKIEEVDEAFSQQGGVSAIQQAVKSQWQKYHTDSKYTDAKIRFNSTDLENILKKVEVEFLPTETTMSYKVDELGDGLRSLFYLSLVSSLLEIENTALKEIVSDNPEASFFNIEPPALTIVAVEEPENHISPPLLGKVLQNLRNISSRSNSQTIITSHTPAIIKRVDPKEIRYFRMCPDKLCTIPSKITLPDETDDAYKYVKEAVIAYPELYFARLVVLGEGDSEEIIIPKVLELSGHSIDSSAIAVVPLGGRHVNHFWRLLNELKIPYITLLDLDLERSGGGWGRVKYVIKQLLQLGHDKIKLLKLKNKPMVSNEELETMHEKSVSERQNINAWVNHLENYSVYFSFPLDIDFMMLEAFSGEYFSILDSNEGPYIKDVGKILYLTDEEKKTKEYKKRIKQDIRATLKAEGGKGVTYNKTQKELMIWYTYFFLNRGKPSTHILALTNIDTESLNNRLPRSLQKLKEHVESVLDNDPFSDVGTVN